MLELNVSAGAVERVGSLVTVPMAAGRLPRQAAGPVGGQTEAAAVTLRALDDGTTAPAQYDPAAGELVFVLPGTLPAGGSRRFTVEPEVRSLWPLAVELVQKLDRVIFVCGGQPWASYNVQGARRPYFWPLLGPSGASVIRGQGTGDHPHHTGMGLSYGGHSEGGSANIWSDWDEPPYGPGGRMLHRGLRRVAGGAVYGELVQDLSYLNAYGDPIAEEVRTIRSWWASPRERFVDFHVQILSCRDRGPRPFLFMLRLPGSMDIPSTGHITNAAGHPVPPVDREDRYYRAAWVDASGPSGTPPGEPPRAAPETLVDLPGAPRPRRGPGSGPWNGIALFDHPHNDGYPNVVGKYAVVQQITQCHYPPADSPDGPFRFRHRVYVHDGDAEAAGVAARAADYAQPCEVTVRESD